MRLELSSRPESVTLVRVMLGGIAEWFSFDPELLDDLKTAVSEACNNVVMHAYGDETGPLVVSLAVTADGAEVTVRDWGSGIQHVAPSQDRIGVGLAVISALAKRAEFLSPNDGGTEVRMLFGRHEPPVQSEHQLPESEPVLQEIANAMTTNPSWSLSLGGHTDKIGGDSFNQVLSERRATAVKQALVEQYHVSADRLTTVGYGSTRPKEPNDTLEGRARNRRVELVRL